jgi:hypothetical protein
MKKGSSRVFGGFFGRKDITANFDLTKDMGVSHRKKAVKAPIPSIIFPKRLQFHGFCDILFLITDQIRMDHIYGYEYPLPLY